jgi:adenylate cyclase, class 1
VKEHYTLPSIHLGSPGEDICIKDLHTLKQRFKQLHQMREQRVQEFLQPRQRVFLELLPLLFHQNHPLLPGFISSETPVGIPDYKPSSQVIKTARQFTKNFSYSHRLLSHYAIEALFLMGSVGSIAFSKTSDMDIWLCHDPSLVPNDLHELQKKASAIEIWAASLGLEVHFFLMNSERFRLGHDTPLSTESSGKTQHYLLLEEFYRTAIYIAGKSPAWWLVPPHEENNYTQYVKHLRDNRFVYEHELIDFGGLDAVPAEEFISATLWHLYKSIHAPHKSLLKLLLMECYASEYPKTQWLSLEIKQAIFQGNFMTTDLDPYRLIYHKVETYLEQEHNVDRLALARQCFYLKIMGASDNAMDVKTRTFREHYMRTIALIWGWPDGMLADLKRQKFWDIKKATQEHAVILQQLTNCFRMIMGFASEHVKQDYKDSDDIKLIGRKLHAFLEKRPGKIEIITTRSAVHVKEHELSLVESRFTGGKTGWALFLKQVQMNNAAESGPIKKCRTLIELFVWLVINELYQKSMQLHFSAHSLTIRETELHSILTSLELFLKRHFSDEIPLNAFRNSKNLMTSMLVINLGLNDADARDNGMRIMSARSDALSYGVERQSFVQTVDRVSVSSWGEITTHQYQEVDGLFNCLTDIINSNRKPMTPDDLSIVCLTPVRAQSIRLRVQVVFSAMIKLFVKTSSNRSPRYIVPGGSAYYVFQNRNKVLSFHKITTKDLLFKELASPQECFSQLFFDQAVFEDTPIPLIYTQNKPDRIQLFYQEHKTGISLYIIDERGTLFSQQHGRVEPKVLLSQYTAFLESVLNRYEYEKLLSFEYYEIQKNSTGVLSCSPVALKVSSSQAELSVRITGETVNNGLIYTIYCNEQEFSSLDYGNQVFHAAHQCVLQFRRSKQDYPIHITDIDLPLSAFHISKPDQLQSIHYLNYKQKIEAKLNA